MKELEPGQTYMRVRNDLPEVRVLLRRTTTRTAWGYYWLYFDLVNCSVDKTVEFYFTHPRTAWKLVG